MLTAFGISKYFIFYILLYEKKLCNFFFHFDFNFTDNCLKRVKEITYVTKFISFCLRYEVIKSKLESFIIFCTFCIRSKIVFYIYL